MSRSLLCLSLLLCALSVSADAFRAPSLHFSPSSPTLHKPIPNHPQHVPLSTAIAAAPSAAINKAAIKAISKLLSTCGIGIIAGKAKILDQAALSVLSKLIFNVFQPCLLFVNVASTVANLGKSATGSPAAIYLLPIAALLQIVIGFIVGKIVAFFMYGKDGVNSESAKQLQACTTFGNSGPLPLVFTDGLFRAHSNTALLPQSVAYISLYLLGWSPLFWIIGPAILQENKSNGTSPTAEEQAKKRKELFERVFSPPVVASLLGMVAGFIPQLQRLFISSNGLLNPVFEAMRTLGAAYLPAVLLVLAGSLSASSPADTNHTATNKPSNLLYDILPIYLARFVLMPLVGFSVAALAMKTSPWAHSLFTKDPMLLLVLLLETCMPSAQNTTVILQLQGEKSAAGRLARKLMLIYVLGVPAITYWFIRILGLTGLA
jgi:auxin efflux carrier family protein